MQPGGWTDPLAEPDVAEPPPEKPGITERPAAEPGVSKRQAPALPLAVSEPPTASPRNPYKSFVVSASAGSGKTYQLSRRFLFLVAAGAEPGSILTVTFTRKAAGEMRARILQEASRLASDQTAQAQFAAELSAYYEATGRSVAPPLAPAAAARAILASSQALKIMTIDSVFLEWVSKFTYESSGAAAAEGGAETGGEGAELPSPFDLLDAFEEEELDAQAWGAACAVLARGIDAGDERFAAILHALPKGSPTAARAALDRLAGNQTALWYEERRRGEALSPHELPLDYDAVDMSSPDAGTRLMATLETELTAVIGQLSREDLRNELTAAIARRDYEALVRSPLVTKAGALSKTYVTAKKRALIEREAATVEDELRRFENARRLAALNLQGASLYALYRMQRAAQAYLKRSSGRLGFSDLAQGAFRLFHQDAGAGVRFLLARTVRHLMLDEFQDTSRLQWSVFAALAGELTAGDDLAGPGELPGSVFIVGDAKQSIYGFREADPAVMGDAVRRFEGRADVATLSKSYRTAQVVLDFVNETFGDGALADFPPHATAESAPGKAVIPDVGRVVLAPLLEDDPADTPQETARRGAEKEAVLVADALAAALGVADGALPSPVFDKERGDFRPLTAGDCAILYRSGTNAELFEEALRARGIPCHKEEQHGFFGRPEVRDALSLLRFLCIPADLPALLAVLRSPFGRVEDELTVQLLDETRGAEPADRSRALLLALATHEPELAATLTAALARVGKEPLNAIADGALSALDAEAAYGHSLVNDAAEGLLARQNLRRLLEIALALETGSGMSPTALLGELERLAERNETGNAPAQGGSVTLMTIHKSKGLEYPLVALVDTARPWAQKDPYWVSSPAENGDGRTFYYVGTRDGAPEDDAAFDRLAADFDAGTRAECMRLLYVAMTRARQYLFVTGHRPPRIRGVDGTVFYEHLRDAQLSPMAPRTATPLSLGGVTLSVWESEPRPDGIAMSAPRERTDASGDLLAGLVHEADPRASTLPSELGIVTPSHGHGEDLATAEDADAGESLPLDASVPSADTALFGTLVHSGLQAWLEDRPFDLITAWRAAVPGRERPDWLARAAAQLLAFQQDPIWLGWRATTGVSIRCELPLVHLDGHELVQGAADAVVEMPDGPVLVIDFKTTLFLAGTEPSEAALRAFCRRRGFEGQLGSYARALRAIEPGRTVSALVYFVERQAFVPLPV